MARLAGRIAPLLLLASLAAPAAAQTMLDQELRLIDVHDLLLDLPALQAPGALRPMQLDVGAEVITIPTIDGTTGGKVQLTASDHTRAYPRPRLMLGLPAPAGWRAFVGAAYVPPVTIREVSTHLAALEAGLAWTRGPLAVGVRGHGVYAHSRSPVTERATKDTLETAVAGAQLSAGWELGAGPARVTPYAGAGVVYHHGRFRVTSDGVVLTSDGAVAALHGGVRIVAWRWLEGVAELDAYPGRLVHPNFRIGLVGP